MFGSKMYSLNLGLMILALAGVLVGAAGFYAGFSSPSSNTPIVLGDTNIIRIDTGGNSTPSTKNDTDNLNDGTSNPDPVEIDPDEKPVDPRIDVEPEIAGDGKITGKVFNYQGRPVNGAKVFALPTDANTYFAGTDLDPRTYTEEAIKALGQKAKHTYTGRTRSDGSFVIKGLDESKAYNLSVYETGIGAASIYNIAANDETEIFLLQRLIPLRGKVSTSSGKLPKNFTVNAYRVETPDDYTTANGTFDSGKESFTLYLPEEGEWVVIAQAEGFFQENKTSTNVGPSGSRVTLQLNQGATLSGTVLPEQGEALPNISVTLYASTSGNDAEDNYDLDEIYNGPSRKRRALECFSACKKSSLSYPSIGGSGSSFEERFGLNYHYTSTDSKGRFEFTSLPPGEYTITANFGDDETFETINLVAGKNTIDLAINPGITFDISVVDTKGNQVRSPSIYAYSIDENDNPVEYVQMTPVKATPQGTRYVGLEEGRFHFTISANGYTGITEIRDVYASGTELSFTLERPVSLNGQLSMSDGSSISSNLYARVRDANSENPDAWETFISIASQETFSVQNIKPGTKKIEIVSYNSATGSYEVRYSTTLTLLADEKPQTLVAVLEPSCNLSISVLDESGNPLTYGYVHIQGDGFSQTSYVSEGTTQIEVFEPGTYTITPHDSNNSLAGDSLDIYLRPGTNDATLYVKGSDCVEVTYVQPDSQAAKIGLQVGDKITYYNGMAVSDINELAQLVRSIPADNTVSFSISRNGAYMSFVADGGLLGINGKNSRQ